MSVRIYGFRCVACKTDFSFCREESEGPASVVRKLMDTNFQCPVCDSASLVPVLSELGDGAIALSSEDMLRAFMGGGLPGQPVLTFDMFEALLIEVGVESVDYDPSPTGKILLKSLLFRNGMRVSFTISGYGVCAYKLTAPKEREHGNGTALQQTEEGHSSE